MCIKDNMFIMTVIYLEFPSLMGWISRFPYLKFPVNCGFRHRSRLIWGYLCRVSRSQNHWPHLQISHTFAQVRREIDSHAKKWENRYFFHSIWLRKKKTHSPQNKNKLSFCYLMKLLSSIRIVSYRCTFKFLNDQSVL